MKCVGFQLVINCWLLIILIANRTDKGVKYLAQYTKKWIFPYSSSGAGYWHNKGCILFPNLLTLKLAEFFAQV